MRKVKWDEEGVEESMTFLAANCARLDDCDGVRWWASQGLMLHRAKGFDL